MSSVSINNLCIADYDPACIMLHRQPHAMRTQ